MAQHAKLSPSSAHRWMNCAGSVALIGDESSTAGIEAMRGTAAHRIIEHMLKGDQWDATDYLGANVFVDIASEKETEIWCSDAPVAPGNIVRVDAEAEHPFTLDRPGWQWFVADDTMIAGVQMMLDEVARVRDELFDPMLYTERFLDMTWLDSRLGGTADVTLYEPASWIHLFDYKNGRIVVEVKGNEQMKNYAVGLLHEHPEARGVTVHLVQPNGFHEDGTIREESYTVDELKLFEIQMKQAADATSKPNAPRRAGNWCTFCPAKVRCPEFDAVALAEAGADFADDPLEGALPLMTGFAEEDVFNEAPSGQPDDEYRAMLARKRKWVPVLDQWAKDINQAILNEWMNSRPVPGTKLVQGKTNRAYLNDEPTTAAALVSAGLPDDQLWSEPKLKSPAQVEKIRVPGVLKPAAIKSAVALLVHKPPGRITVADEDDPREAVDPATAAASDFADDPADGTDQDFV